VENDQVKWWSLIKGRFIIYGDYQVRKKSDRATKNFFPKGRGSEN